MPAPLTFAKAVERYRKHCEANGYVFEQPSADLSVELISHIWTGEKRHGWRLYNNNTMLAEVWPHRVLI